MRIETPIILPSPWRKVNIAGAPPGESAWSFKARDAGGGAATGPSSGISWRLHAADANVLDVTRFSLSAEPSALPAASAHEDVTLRFAFPSPLLPSVASVSLPGGGLSIFVLSSSGHLWQIALPASASAPSEASHHVAPTDISAELEALGEPTCLTAGSNVLAVGTSSGTCVVFPLMQPASASASPHLRLDRPAELRGASWNIGSLLPSIFGSVAVAGMVDVAILPTGNPSLGGSGPLLLALHTDGAIVGWCLRRNSRVLLSPLVPEGFPQPHPDLHPSQLAAAWGPGGSVRFAASLADGRGAGGVWAGQLVISGTMGGELRLEGSAAPLEGFEGQVMDLKIEHGGSRIVALVQRKAGVHFVEADFSERSLAIEGLLLEEDLRNWLPDADSIVDTELLKSLSHELGCTAETGASDFIPRDLGLEDHFLDRLLDLHTVSRPALKEALVYLGFSAAASEVGWKCLKDLRQTVSGCISGTKRTSMGSWRDLLAAYWAAWQVHEAPAALMLHEGCGLVGVIRGAAGVGLLRYASPMELLISGKASQSSMAAELPDAHMAPELMALASCASAVRSCFGSVLSGLFLSATRSGRSPEQELLPAFSRILTTGPTGSSRPSDYERQAFSEWRQKRRKTILLISRRLGSLENPAAALLNAIGVLRQTPKDRNDSDVDSEPRHLSTRVVAAVAAQLAVRRAAACCDLMMLVSVIENAEAQPPPQGPCLSEVTLTAQAELLSSSLALTLATFPVEVSKASMSSRSDPGVALKQLSLESTGLTRSYQGNTSAASMDEVTAAERLASSSSYPMPAFTPSACGQAAAGITCAGLHFASWLSLGGESQDQGETNANDSDMEALPDPSPVDAVVKAAITEYSQHPRHLRLVRQLVGLAKAGGSSSSTSNSSAEMFLEGLCAQLEFSSQLPKPNLEVLMERSVRPLLRAEPSVDSHPSMAKHLRELKAELTGTPVDKIGDVIKEDYYNTIMLFFEQHGCPEGAAHFARAAVRRCEGREEEVGSERLGLLWAALFGYTAEACDWQEAYAALLSNPDPEHTRGCLHQMIRLLMSAKRVDLICSLPWAGTRVLVPDGPPVPLIQEVVTYLRRWADESDLYETPQPYAVLFDLCVMRNDFRGAADAQLCLARRLVVDRRELGLDGLRSIEAALNSAHDALSLMDSPQAWLEEPLGGHGSLVDYSKQPPLWSGLAQSSASQKLQATPPRAATPASLRRESALVAARAAVAEAMPTSPAADLTTSLAWHDVFASLLAAGMESEAIVLALAWAQHKELDMTLEEAVRCMSEKAVRLQVQVVSGGATDGLQLADIQMTGTATSPGDGPTASEAWAQLRQHLDSLGAASAKGIHLAIAAADTILTIRRSIKLPQWLVDMFGEEPEASVTVGESWRNPAALLRLYLKYDKLQEARTLVCNMLNAWKEIPFTKRQKGGAWFPFNLIDTLHVRLSEDSTDGQELAALVQETLDMAKSDASITMAQATAG